MSIPPDYPAELDALDPLLLERQRRRYASRAIAYLVLLNGAAALILLGSLPKLATQVPKPLRLVDAMLVFGAGAAIALASTFFAYLRRTVRVRLLDRTPLRITFWWLSVLSAVAAVACFFVGLNMAGRASIPEGPGVYSGQKAQGDKHRKEDSRMKREGKRENKRNKEQDRQEQQGQGTQPALGSSTEQNSNVETAPVGPQPLSRPSCEEANRKWDEGTNTCG